MCLVRGRSTTRMVLFQSSAQDENAFQQAERAARQPKLQQLARQKRLDAETLVIALKMAMKCADLGHPAKAW